MWHLSAANKHGDTYHEANKDINWIFDFIENTIGINNLSRLSVRYVPCK